MRDKIMKILDCMTEQPVPNVAFQFEYKEFTISYSTMFKGSLIAWRGDFEILPANIPNAIAMIDLIAEEEGV